MQEHKIDTAIQAVIFDLDGVLMDSEWLAYLVWSELAERHGGTYSLEQYSETIGTSAEETAEHLMRCNSHLRLAVPEACDWIWKRLGERLRTDIERLPGAFELVTWLAGRGYPLAIASNSITSYVEDALQGLKMAEYFPVRVGIDQVMSGKPAPDVYLAAAQHLGVDPRRCLAVEDSRVGVQAAVAAGMRVLAAPSPHDSNRHFPGAWQVYPSLVEVQQDLQRLLS